MAARKLTSLLASHQYTSIAAVIGGGFTLDYFVFCFPLRCFLYCKKYLRFIRYIDAVPGDFEG